MNDTEYWHQQLKQTTKLYYIINDALNKIVNAPSDREPYNNVEWYKNVAKEAFNTIDEIAKEALEESNIK